MADTNFFGEYRSVIAAGIIAKYDFIDKMLEWSGASTPTKVLDVGCGFGGTSRRLAAKYTNATVDGITLSPEQVKRGTELAQEQCAACVSCCF